MADSRLLDIDALTGVVETFHYDDVDDTNTIECSQDIEPLIDMNRYIANETPGRWKGDVHRVASIPAVVMQDLRQRGILQDPDRLRAWLNDPDNSVFRTRPGRV